METVVHSKGCRPAMSWIRYISIVDRWKSVSSDLMLPVTCMSMNGTRISEHYLQPSRNPPILVPLQTNTWTLLNSGADRALFSISVLFGLLLKCLRTMMRLLYHLLTFSSHIVSDVVVLMALDATWEEQLLNGELIPYFSSIFCWAERLVTQKSSHILKG